MKRKVFCLLFSICLGSLPFCSYAGLIMVGIYSDKIDTWRYWEKQGDEYKYKMIIFNKCDSLVELSIEKVIYKEEWSNLIPDTSKRTFYFDKIVIDKSQHVILDMPSPTEEHEYMRFELNGKECGQLEMQRIPPPHDLPTQKYTSNEGLNGSDHFVWMTKNKLFTSRNLDDTITLHFNYFERMPYDEDGINLLILHDKKGSFAIKTFLNQVRFGTQASDSTLELEVPYKKLITAKKYKVDIVVTPHKAQRQYGFWSTIGLYLFDEGVQHKIVNREVFDRFFRLKLPIIYN